MREMAIAVKTNEYKTSFINNRRYLGNKYKLLPFITGVVNDECPTLSINPDIFSILSYKDILSMISHVYYHFI